MSYSRSSRAYPVDMRNLIERVAASNQAHLVRLESSSKANGLRSRFYAFKAAVRKDAGSPPAWMTKEDIEDLRQFLKVFDSVEFTTQGDALIVSPRDESMTAAQLREAQPVESAWPPLPADDVLPPPRLLEQAKRKK